MELNVANRLIEPLLVQHEILARQKDAAFEEIMALRTENDGLEYTVGRLRAENAKLVEELKHNPQIIEYSGKDALKIITEWKQLKSEIEQAPMMYGANVGMDEMEMWTKGHVKRDTHKARLVRIEPIGSSSEIKR